MAPNIIHRHDYVPGGFPPDGERGAACYRVMRWLGVVSLPMWIALLVHGFLPPSAVPGAKALLGSFAVLLILPPRIIREAAANQANRLAAALALRLPVQLLLARQRLGQIPSLLALVATSLLLVTRSARDRERSIVARTRAKASVPDLALHPRLTSVIVAGFPL